MLIATHVLSMYIFPFDCGFYPCFHQQYLGLEGCSRLWLSKSVMQFSFYLYRVWLFFCNYSRDSIETLWSV
uniref:Uncharacterized protein n=1 Tax=Helianthus annuus TaxID=4232 RepID=A0A251VKW9_HELAN